MIPYACWKDFDERLESNEIRGTCISEQFETGCISRLLCRSRFWGKLIDASQRPLIKYCYSLLECSQWQRGANMSLKRPKPQNRFSNHWTKFINHSVSHTTQNTISALSSSTPSPSRKPYSPYPPPPESPPQVSYTSSHTPHPSPSSPSNSLSQYSSHPSSTP